MKKIIAAVLCAALCITCLAVQLSAVSTELFTEYVNSSALEAKLTFEYEKFVLPYWYGKIVYYETVLPVEKSDGTVAPIDLMYKADKILTVKVGDITPTTYVEGRDFTLNENGQLVIVETGNIPTIPYSTFYSSISVPGEVYWKRTNGSGYILGGGGSSLMKQQLQVSYIHSDTWEGPVPEYKGDKLPTTVEKLKNGEDVKIAFFGDSITTELISSDANKVYPKCPGWAVLGYRGVEYHYLDSLIYYDNFAVGGWNIAAAYDNKARLSSDAFDLVVIALGANDTYTTSSVDDYMVKYKAIMDEARKTNPDVEFVLVSSMLPNSADCYDIKTVADYVKDLRTEFFKLEGDGVAVVDVTAVSEYLLSLKSFSDMTENNINHPNDFLARAYAQTFISTLLEYDDIIMEFGYSLKGDLDNDGDVDINEARMALQASVDNITFTDDETEITDMNGDGDITATDARIMLMMAIS